MYANDVRRVSITSQYANLVLTGGIWNLAKGTGNNDNKDGKHNNDSNGFVGHTGCDICPAIADICPADTTEVKNCTRILFDSGSQRSYISEKVRTRLQLKTIRREKVIIKTFGQTSDSEVQQLDVV
jgi:hypothetical protein